MSVAHIDPLRDVGPDGPRTARARRHVEECAECRAQVQAIVQLARLYGGERQAPRLRLPGRCLSADEAVRVAADPTRQVPARLRAHLEACADCRAVVEEAQTAMGTHPEQRAAAAALRPRPLRPLDRFDLNRPVLRLAAVPKDITRPAKKKPKPKPKTKPKTKPKPKPSDAPGGRPKKKP